MDTQTGEKKNRDVGIVPCQFCWQERIRWENPQEQLAIRFSPWAARSIKTNAIMMDLHAL